MTTSAFTIDSTAQFISVKVRGLTAGDDSATIELIPAAAATPVLLTITSGVMADSWTTARATVTALRGQSVRMRTTLGATGSVGVDDEGVMRVDFPGWEITGMGTPIGGGANGTTNAAQLDGNGVLTSSAFTIGNDVEQLAVSYKSDAAGTSNVRVELLTGANFGTATVFNNGDLTADQTWRVVRAVVVPFRDQSVKLRLTTVGASGKARFDEAGLGERIIPGWTPEGWANPAAAGDDANGSFVTSAKTAQDQIQMRSSELSLGIADIAGQEDLRLLRLGYEIGNGATSGISVTWAATGLTPRVVFQDSATSVVYRERQVEVKDTDGQRGRFLVVVTGGKLHFFGDNERAWGDECIEKALDPVDSSTGLFGYEVTDLSLGSSLPFEFSRTYLARRDRVGALGHRWMHSFEVRLEFSGTRVGVVWPSGTEEWWTAPGGAGSGTPTDGRIRSKLTKNGDGSFVVRTHDNVLYHFQSNGTLTHLEDLNFNQLVLERDGGGKITRVRERFGDQGAGQYGPRELVFAYTGDRLTSVTGPGAVSVQYAFSAANDLITVVDPVGGGWHYGYDRHRLMTLANPDQVGVDPGVYVFQNGYDDLGRLVDQSRGIGGIATMAYETEDGTTPAKGATRVTDRAGKSRTIYYDHMGATTGSWDATGRGRAHTFDARHNATSITDPVGNASQFAVRQRLPPDGAQEPAAGGRPGAGADDADLRAGAEQAGDGHRRAGERDDADERQPGQPDAADRDGAGRGGAVQDELDVRCAGQPGEPDDRPGRAGPDDDLRLRSGHQQPDEHDGRAGEDLDLAVRRGRAGGEDDRPARERADDQRQRARVDQHGAGRGGGPTTSYNGRGCRRGNGQGDRLGRPGDGVGIRLLWADDRAGGPGGQGVVDGV